MKKILITMLTVITLLSAGDTIKPTWESINSRPYPKWFSDAKLGIFIHWGLPSVPAYSGKEQYAEWFLRGLQLNDSLRVNFQNRVYGENFTYRDYAPLFKAELFNPQEWATLFKNSGARYVLFVSKHHDGYCLWPSEYAPNWNSVDVGPHRDIVGDLTTAVRDAGLRMGLYYSLTEWNNNLHRWYTDPHDEIDEYVNQYMIPQFKELVKAYKPSIIFSDGEWYNKASDFHAKELISWYYNFVGPDAIVNNRWGHGSDTGYLTPEYSSGITAENRPWAEVRGLGRSFGLNRNEPLDAYMTSKELIHLFIKSVAYGGGLTINVGPKADGQIPLLQQERLLALGNWLKDNGEAIYGSQRYDRQSEKKHYTVERIDSTINFNWVRNTPADKIACDDFQATWTGFIRPEKTTEYTFTAKADDGMRLWIGDQLVINQWQKTTGDADGNVMGNDQATIKDGKLKLFKNKSYPIKIEYFENKQNAALHLFWESNFFDKEIIPASVLAPNQQFNEQGLKARYHSQGDYLCYTKNHGNLYAIALEWPGDELILPISTNGNQFDIQLLGTNISIPYQKKEDQLIIDLSEISYTDMPNHTAWVFKLNNYFY